MEKTVTEDLHIRPSTTGIRSIDPDNVASLNAKGNFIAHTGTFELVRVPLFRPRKELLDAEVSSIDRELAKLSLVTTKAVLPSNLC